MSKYGPNDSYPKEILCNSCNEKIFIQWSTKTLKEYITENKAWQKGTNGATFHKCSNWKGRKQKIEIFVDQEDREWIEEIDVGGIDEKYEGHVPEKIQKGKKVPIRIFCPISNPCWMECKKEYCGVYSKATEQCGLINFSKIVVYKSD